jgi:5-methylcytosine-specific restriction enzyme subunit McrC
VVSVTSKAEVGGVRYLDLVEERDECFDVSELSEDDAIAIHQRWRRAVTAELPSRLNGGRTQLRSHGVVGLLPVRPGLCLRVAPKAPLQSVMRMLEVAFGLSSFRVLDDLAAAERIDELFESLVAVLCRRVLGRLQKGLHRDYVPLEEALATVRGQLDVVRTVRDLLRGEAALHCRFEELTSDLDVNQVLLATLHRLRARQFARPEVGRLVRGAVQGLASDVSLVPVDRRAWARLTYTPATSDYRGLHALSRLLMEAAALEPRQGDEVGVPFVLRMPALFEEYCARWMAAELSGRVMVRPQEPAPLGGSETLGFRIDAVLRDAADGRFLAVVDAKYKTAPEPQLSDVQQVVAYAVRMGTDTGVLLRPRAEGQDLDLRVGGVTVLVRSVDLVDLESAGNRDLIEELGALCAAR